MTTEELSHLIDLAHEQFENARITPNTLEIWKLQIGNLNFGACRTALLMLLGNNLRKPPSPKEVAEESTKSVVRQASYDPVPTEWFRDYLLAKERLGLVCVITERANKLISYAFRSKSQCVQNGYCRLHGVLMRKWEMRDDPSYFPGLNETQASQPNNSPSVAVISRPKGVFEPRPDYDV